MADLVNAITTILCMCVIVGGLLYAQYSHQKFIERIRRRTEWQDELSIQLAESRQVMEKFKDYDEYKKRVDALTLRAGFKL